MADRKFWSMMHRLATQEKYSADAGASKGKEKDKQRKKASPLLHGLIRLARTHQEHREDLLPIIASEMEREARKRMRKLRRKKRKKKIPLFKIVGISEEKWKELDADGQIKLAERAYERLSKRSSLSRKQKRMMTIIRFWYNSKGRKYRARRQKFYSRLQRFKQRQKKRKKR